MVRIAQARRAALIILFTFGFAAMSWVPRIPEIKANLGVNAATFGAVTSFGTVGAIASTFLASRVLHSIGSRYAIALFGTGTYLALALIPLQRSAFTYALVIMFYGASTGALSTSLNVQSLHIEEERGVPSMSAFHGWWAAGALLTGILSSVIVDLVALSAHVISLALAATIILWLNIPRLASHSEESGGEDEVVQIRSLMKPSRTAFLVGLGLGCGGFAEYANGDWSALYLRDVLDASLSRAAFAFTFIMGAITLSRLTGDRLTALYGPQRIIQGAASCILGGLSLVSISGHFATQLPHALLLLLTYTGFAITGLGSGVMVPLFVSATANISGTARAIAIGQVILIQQCSVWVLKQVMAWSVANIGLVNAILLPGLTAMVALSLSGLTATKQQATRSTAQ